MKLNHFICPNCGHDFYATGAYATCDACNRFFYAAQSGTCRTEMVPRPSTNVFVNGIPLADWIGKMKGQP